MTMSKKLNDAVLRVNEIRRVLSDISTGGLKFNSHNHEIRLSLATEQKQLVRVISQELGVMSK